MDEFTIASIEEGDTLSAVDLPTLIHDWLHFYQVLDTGFTLRRFKASGVTLHMEELSSAIQNSNAADFSRFFHFSPDNRRYLDLVSYSFQVSKGKLVPGEADQQVVLADVSAQKRFQLLYYGPGQLAEASGWLSNDKFMVSGTSRSEDGRSFSAEILLFDLRDSLYTNFKLDHLVQTDAMGSLNCGFLEQYYHDLKK